MAERHGSHAATGGAQPDQTAAILAIVGCIFYAQILVLVTMPVAAHVAGLAPASIGLLLALPGATSLVADVPVASLSDGFGRRSFIVVGGILLVGAGLMLAVASTDAGVWALGMLLAGGAMALLVAPALALLTESVEADRHRRIQGLNGSIQAGVSIVAVVVSGLLLAVAAPTIAFLTASGCGLAVALLGRGLTERPRRVRGTTLEVAVAGYRTAGRLVRMPLVALATLLAVVYGLLFLVAGNGFLPAFAISLAVPPAVVGVLLAVRTAVIMLVSPSFARVSARFGVLRPVIVLTLVGAIGIAIVALAPDRPAALLPAVVLQGLGIAYAAAAANVWVAEATSPSARAVAIAASNLGSRISLVVAAPLFGVAAQADGRAPFLAAAALLVTTAVVMRALHGAVPSARSAELSR